MGGGLGQGNLCLRLCHPPVIFLIRPRIPVRDVHFSKDAELRVGGNRRRRIRSFLHPTNSPERSFRKWRTSSNLWPVTPIFRGIFHIMLKLQLVCPYPKVTRP